MAPRQKRENPIDAKEGEAMENVEIARVLNEYADFLDIQDVSPFRVRSYRRTAQTIEGLSRRVAQLVEEGADLTTLPGIGSSMAEHIREILSTGTLATLADVRREFPETLATLLQLEHLGPKRARRLYEALDITSIPKLAEALDAGKVEALPGFGRKTAESLRRAIESFEQRGQRFLLADADQLILPLLSYLRQAPGLEVIEVAGSFRRRRETVGDIDIVAICEQSEPFMQHFQAYRHIGRVELAGKTRATVFLQSGLQVDLRVVPRQSYGAALYYFTGSKAHNVAVRTLAVERGLRINEYGIFRIPQGRKAKEEGEQAGKRIGGETEEDMFRAVGLMWMPPELREDRGEIQAAQQHALPTLITLDDIRGDLQMHSTWSDGSHTIAEMARACRELGYAYCAITDHSRSTRVARGLDTEGFRRQWKEIDEVRHQLNGITVLKGVELDILSDGTLDLPDEVLEGFDIVLVAVHSKLAMPKAQMTKRVLKALSHPAVDILAHPTGRQLNKRQPMEIDLEDVFHAAKEHDVALEIDAQPQRLDLNDVHVHRARELGVTLAIDSDAHSVDHLRFMRYGVDQARRGWLENSQVLNTLTWPEFQRWLKRRRP
jgi:DNA polymerase (family 10)